MQYIAYFIIIFTFILIIVYTYNQIKTDLNKELIKNIDNYAKKEKIEQLKSKIYERKTKKHKKNKKERTRMYHL
tara:strand:- start:53 stop:274 length:222 start_codon:yes stop_codon:yes gene_type:complete